MSVTARSLPARPAIEPLAPHHAGGVAALLRDGFPQHLLVDLGASFTEEFVRAFTARPENCSYVCLDGDEVVGCLIGSDQARLQRQILVRRHGFRLLRRVLPRLTASPRLVWRLACYARPYLSFHRLAARTTRSNGDDGATAIPDASLLLLAISTSHRRQGIASALMWEFLEDLKRRGADGVKLSVAASNRGALRFYLAGGWRHAGRFPSPNGDSAHRLLYPLPCRQANLSP